ncbi:MAG: hypothetical protein ACNA8P_01570 [Phycisphaerales bacterium]
MSHSIEVYCDKSRLPSIAAWNQAIQSRGFDAEISGFDWSTVDGCVDANLLGYSMPLELIVDDEELSSASSRGFFGKLLGGKRKAGDSNSGPAPAGPVTVQFVLHSSFYEMVLASIASVTLAELTGGTTGYEGEETNLDESAAGARSEYVQAMLYIARLNAGKAGLAWDAPALLPFETKDSRLESLSSASDLRLAEDSSPGDERWYLKSIRLQDHLTELGSTDRNQAGSS